MLRRLFCRDDALEKLAIQSRMAALSRLPSRQNNSPHHRRKAIKHDHENQNKVSMTTKCLPDRSSSKKEHKVNALASGADEGRDKLR